MGVNSLPKTVTRQRRDYNLNPGTLTTRLPSHRDYVLHVFCGFRKDAFWRFATVMSL